MISQYALNTNGICSGSSFRQSRPEGLSSLMERSLGSTSNSHAASFLHSNEQLVLEQQAMARLERAKLLSLQDQMKDATNISSHSQHSVATSQRSGQKRSADALGPTSSSDVTLLLHKQEQLQNVLRKNHREVMASAALGLIANAKSNKTRRTSPQLSPVTSELSSKSRLNHLLLLQQHLKLQSSQLNILEPSTIQGHHVAGYALKNALPYLGEEERLAAFLKLQQENELQQEILQNFARQDLYGTICKKIQEEKVDKQRQLEKLTQHEQLLLLLQKKQEEEQQQKLQENLLHEQLYSMVQQRQFEEQQRELQLRMATMEKLQQVQSEERPESYRCS
jgi:hypothetical protein